MEETKVIKDIQIARVNGQLVKIFSVYIDGIFSGKFKAPAQTSKKKLMEFVDSEN